MIMSKRPLPERELSHTAAPRALRWRADIQGLRGVAVLAIVLYHADPTALSGGYVGVDVFYVISGFLITRMLIRELEQNGTISLRRFYARRIRRLLPMAFLVISATVLAADWLQSPLDAARTAKDALASALYLGNYRFALQQTNYLYSGLTPSPLQHYWSLGVEEQMYLVWPVLLLAASGLWWRKRLSTEGAVVLLGLGSICSFLLCLRLTSSNEPWAFFSFPTRAWELGVGGLVAFGAPALRTLRPAVSMLLGAVGLAAVVAATLHFGATTPWPGSSALLPVLGAAGVIMAGCGKGGHLAGRVLAFWPLQFSGQISYSWYLWHWPALILAPVLLKHPLTNVQALGIAGAAAVLAPISFYLVEQPIHVSTWLARKSRRGLALGIGLTSAATAVCSLSVIALALPTAAAQPRRLPLPTIVTKVRSFTSLDPQLSELQATTAQMQSLLASSSSVTQVPQELQPPLASAFSDVPVLYNDGCVDAYTSTLLASCTYGDASSPKSVVLFGDSHAAMWFPAINAAAQQYSWKLYAWTKATCPPLEITVFSPDLGRTYTECTTWRDEVLQQIATLHPSMVILGVARHYSPIYGFSMYDSQWMSGLIQMITEIRDLGPRVVLLGPIPKPATSIPNCLSANLDNAPACATSRDGGVDLPGMRTEESVVRAVGGYYINTLWWLCSAQAICPPIISGFLVYRDDNHLTATFAGLLSTPVGDALDLVMQGVTTTNSAVLVPPDPP